MVVDAAGGFGLAAHSAYRFVSIFDGFGVSEYGSGDRHCYLMPASKLKDFGISAEVHLWCRMLDDCVGFHENSPLLKPGRHNTPNERQISKNVPARYDRGMQWVVMALL